MDAELKRMDADGTHGWSGHLRFGHKLLLLCLSIFSAVLCEGRIIDTFLLSADFTVKSTYRVCEQPLNNRCVTHYDVLESDGASGDFVPFGYQFEPGILQPEVHIRKNAYSFRYEIDGISRRWPYLWSHIIVFLVGIAGALVWVRLWWPRWLGRQW